MAKFSLSLGLACIIASMPGILSAFSPASSNQQSTYTNLQYRQGLFGRTELVAQTYSINQLMGYTDSAVPADIEMPDNMKSWMRCVDEAVQFVIEHPEQALGTARRSSVVIKPLLGNIMWDQSAPFSDLCPEGTPVGCVATAMAQVLYFYRYPEHGFGTDTYTNHGITHTVDFGNTYYQWDQMYDYYSSRRTAEQNHAVAELSYHCGVAVHMDYAAGGSGAWTERIPAKLHEHFGYNSKAVSVGRSSFSYDEWSELLVTELLAGRPVIFAGTSSDVGHCFVIDGINEEGLFHVNWGWSGYYNGYFDIGILEPEGQGIGGSAEATMGFCTNQRAVLQLCPEEGVGLDYSPLYCNPYWGEYTDKRCSLTFTYENRSGYDFDARLGYRIYDSQGECICVSDTIDLTFGHYPSRGYWQWGTIDAICDSGMTDGNYQLEAFCTTSITDSIEYTMFSNKVNGYKFSIVDGQFYADFDTTYLSFCAGNFNHLDQEIFSVGRTYDFSFDLTNKSADTFVGMVRLFFSEQGNDDNTITVNSGDVKLLPGETQNLQIPVKFDKNAIWDFWISPWHYGYEFYDYLQIEQKPTIVTDYTAESPYMLTLASAPVLLTEDCEVDGDVSFELCIDNAGGIFDSQLAIQFFSSKNSTTKAVSAFVQNQRIETTTTGNIVIMNGKLTGLKANTRYYARAYYKGLDGAAKQLLMADGTSAPIEVKPMAASAIEYIQEDTVDDLPAYDLMGRRMKAGQQGISIQRHAASLR